MLSNLLYQPGINKTLSMLDDSQSMFSIAVRDGIDSSGRTLMEYRRDPHGGRERLIEEFLTLVIWGFGINFLKNRVYDPLAKKLSPIRHPGLDMDLLLEGPQKLAPDVIKRFQGSFPGVYDKLGEVIQSPKLQQKYHVSNVAKFLIATGIPVMLIGFAIPTLNQWLTRKRLDPTNSLSQANTVCQRRLLHTNMKQPNVFSAFAHVEPSDESRMGMNQESAPRFAGLGTTSAMLASKFLQNERYNTLLVDNVISGGRISKARNWTERLEIIFREGTIIFFLYFAQGFIQNKIGRLMGKRLGINPGLDFQALKYLREHYGNDKHRFLADLKNSRAMLEKLLPDVNAGKTADIEKKMVDAVRGYFLKGQSDNLIFETAQACRWIKTLPADPKNAGRKLLDLSQKIQTEPIVNLMVRLDEVAGKIVKSKTSGLESLLKKCLVGRFSALMLSNAICALFLSFIFPKIQHWITYQRTGKNYFPGVEAA